MATLTRDGVTIYYEVHGTGPAIFLTHGFSATSHMWKAQIDVLSKDHTLILWDMRGHGKTDYPEDAACYSEEETIKDMLAILDELNIESAIIGGMSLGGYMSLAFHRLHPERVNALMIVDSGPGYKSDEAREKWNAQCDRTAQALTEGGLEYLETRSPETAGKVHTSTDGLAKAARGMMAQQGDHVIFSLPDIAVPTLIVVGADDKPFLGASDYMTAKIDGATKVVIPDAGHAANMDQPEIFNKAARSFLNGLS